MEDYTAQALALAALSKVNKSTSDLSTKADLVNGKVPASQLPSYVDDVLEYSSIAAFPATGESGKIYVATDTNKTYRWGGSAYVEISESLALGETASTAYAGNKGKANADAIAAIKDGTNIDSFSDVEQALENIPSVTVDQTFDPTSANAQSGVAVQQAIDSRVYTVSFRRTPVATYISSQSFTNPYGNQGYIYTMAFHVRQTAPAGIPAGKYVAIHVNYGLIGFTIENDMLYAHCVITDYGTNNVTIGSTTTLSTFTNMPAYKID